MRIAFFSDIHGNKYVLEDFFKKVSSLGIDQLVFCGDIFGYYYYQNEIIDCFRKLSNLSCVLGNHDQFFLDLLEHKRDEATLVSKYGNSYKNIEKKISPSNVSFIKHAKKSLVLEDQFTKIGVFHGSPNNLIDGRIYPDTILEPNLFSPYSHVILGHTHHKMVRNINATIVINPGSIGQQRDGRGCSFLVLDTNSGIFDFHTVNYPIDLLLADIDHFDNGNPKLRDVLLRKSNNV